MDITAYLTPLAVLSVFVALDVLTGVASAIAAAELSSSKMRDGLFHKLAFYGAYVLAVALEYAAGVFDLNITIPAAGTVAAYIVATEVVSILENLCKMNPELKNSKFLSMFGDE